MTSSLLVLCAAAAAVIAFSTSILVGASLRFLQAKLNRLTPAAEARLLFGAALLPLLVTIAIMTAALAPAFGWIVDHCVQVPDPHGHPHICTAHHVSVLPAATVIAFAGVLAIRVFAQSARFLAATWSSVQTRRVLSTLAESIDRQGVSVLPMSEPQAFVVGVFRPQVFITRGLLSVQHRAHLSPVLAHERAHVRRRDPLRRAVATLALSFHVPVLARWLERRLARAQEMAADAEAARDSGSREAVASALVRLTRASLQVPNIVLAFGQSDVAARVTALLDDGPRIDRPHRSALLAAMMLLFVVIGISADAVHHGVEIVLGLLNG